MVEFNVGSLTKVTFSGSDHGYVINEYVESERQCPRGFGVIPPMGIAELIGTVTDYAYSVVEESVTEEVIAEEVIDETLLLAGNKNRWTQDEVHSDKDRFDSWQRHVKNRVRERRRKDRRVKKFPENGTRTDQREKYWDNIRGKDYADGLHEGFRRSTPWVIGAGIGAGLVRGIDIGLGLATGQIIIAPRPIEQPSQRWD